MIRLDIQKRHIHLTKEQLGLATAAFARTALKPQFLKAIAGKVGYDTTESILIDETILKRMIVKYSEQLIYKPLDEIRHWFTYESGAFIEPGYPPLFYSHDKNYTLSPNKSAVAGIGEGVAGFLSQRLYQCRKLARPIHDYPDIVAGSGRYTYLFESKATVARPYKEILDEIDSELPRLAAYVASCSELDTRPVTGVLIGTAITSETSYQCCLTEITTPRWDDVIQDPLPMATANTVLNHRINSDIEFIVTSIIESIQNNPKRDTEYSSTIELALTELVRATMRTIAQENIQRGSRRVQLLLEAIDMTELQIKEYFDLGKKDFNIDEYLKMYHDNIKKHLKYAGQEIENLTSRLMDSRERSRIGDRQRQKTKKGVLFEVINIGLREMIEGILVRPINKGIGINIDTAKTKYDVKGDWYPFAITINRFTFVADDDGTIFVSTDNLPHDLVYEAREILNQLASDLYTL